MLNPESNPFHGTLTALVTPFHDGEVDYRALQELVEYNLKHGVNGLVVCGTTGESPTLNSSEQASIVATVVGEVKGRVPVIAGTGTNCTSTTLSFSREAIAAGADALMLVAPYYNKPNQRGLYQHFHAVARNTNNIPIMLYNVPSRTGTTISNQTIAKLHDNCPQIQAVKDATGNLEAATELTKMSDITILSGDDTRTLPLISIGAKGVVSVLSNLRPNLVVPMVKWALSNNMDQAKLMNGQIFQLAHNLLSLDTNPIPVKTALFLEGMIREEFRLPLCSMDKGAKNRLKEILVIEKQGK